MTGTTWKYENPQLPSSRLVRVEDNWQIDWPLEPRDWRRPDPTLSCLELNGASWVDQPRVWQNFVLHTLPCDQPNYDECWRIVKEALAKWELHMPERNLVCGSAEHMLLWRLAYE